MANLHNQTDPAWLVGPSGSGKGTGVFLVADVHSEGQPVKKEFVNDITYQDCVRRAAHAIAFKWVPKSIATQVSLSTGSCGDPCVDTCVKPGCVCLNGKCE